MRTPITHDVKIKWNEKHNQRKVTEADALNLVHGIRPNVLLDFYNMYINKVNRYLESTKDLGTL